MPLSNDQVIDVIKIFIGLVIAIVGGLWTYTTYTADVRKSELQTLVGLGDAIAGMQVTCSKKFGQLAELANRAAGSREGRCYAYFQDAHRRSIAAMITVGKPVFCPPDKWQAYWEKLQGEIAGAGTERYDFEAIDKAWTAILAAKGLPGKP